MKTIILLLLLLPLACLLTIGCSDEDIKIATESATELAGFPSVGNPVEVTFNINSLPFEEDEASTRAEEPIEYKPDNNKETNALEKEMVLRTFWIFEFDQETHELIYPPYYVGSGGTDSGQITYHINFSDNFGKEVIFYVIVNGDGTNENASIQQWCKPSLSITSEGDTITTYPGFMTMEELEAQILPTNYEYASSYDASHSWPPYYYSNTGNKYKTGIPKCGKKEHVIVDETLMEEGLDVDVKNMYAKILVYWDDQISTTTPNTNFLIENIPCYCRVGALADSTTTTAYQYPDMVYWTYFSLFGTSNGGIDYDNSNTSFPPVFILYVPENIQGEYGSSVDRNENVPPIPTGYTKDHDKGYSNAPSAFTNDNVSIADNTNALAVHLYSAAVRKWYGPIYPGGNNTTNFNIRRNYSYRVIFKFSQEEEEP